MMNCWLLYKWFVCGFGFFLFDYSFIEVKMNCVVLFLFEKLIKFLGIICYILFGYFEL